jgi:hypothetical protein
MMRSRLAALRFGKAVAHTEGGAGVWKLPRRSHRNAADTRKSRLRCADRGRDTIGWDIGGVRGCRRRHHGDDDGHRDGQ